MLDRVFEKKIKFCNLHLMRGKLMLPDYISEEKLKIDLKMEDLVIWAVLVQAALHPRTACIRMAQLSKSSIFNQFLIFLQ